MTTTTQTLEDPGYIIQRLAERPDLNTHRINYYARRLEEAKKKEIAAKQA